MASHNVTSKLRGKIPFMRAPAVLAAAPLSAPSGFDRNALRSDLTALVKKYPNKDADMRAHALARFKTALASANQHLY